MSKTIEISREDAFYLLGDRGLARTMAMDKLRALLAAPECEKCHSAGKVRISTVCGPVDKSCDQCKIAAPVVERQKSAAYEYYSKPLRSWRPLENEAHRSRAESMGCDVRVTTPPAPVAVVLDERAEFEKFIINRAERFAPDLTRRGDQPDAEYQRSGVQGEWEIWQARACLDKVKELNQ